jgi:hypothetical protein
MYAISSVFNFPELGFLSIPPFGVVFLRRSCLRRIEVAAPCGILLSNLLHQDDILRGFDVRMIRYKLYSPEMHG